MSLHAPKEPRVCGCPAPTQKYPGHLSDCFLADTQSEAIKQLCETLNPTCNCNHPTDDGNTYDWHFSDCPAFEEWKADYNGLSSTDTAGTVTGKYGSTYKGTSFAWHTCIHAMQAFSLPGGLTAYGSSHWDSKHRTEEPDLAVYLDSCWQPRCIAFHLGWQDYGLPYLSVEQVLTVARTALATAKEGKTVETGCMGGHGRTGSFLAILHMLAQQEDRPDRPVNALTAKFDVWDHYCRHAIETASQEWYLNVIQATLNGTPIPKYPRPVKPAITVNKTGGNWVTVNAGSGKRKKDKPCKACNGDPKRGHTCKDRKVYDPAFQTETFTPARDTCKVCKQALGIYTYCTHPLCPLGKFNRESKGVGTPDEQYGKRCTAREYLDCKNLDCVTWNKCQRQSEQERNA